MSDDILDRYRRGEGPLPAAQKVWPLYGAGFENLGQAGRPVEMPLPACGPDEILVRHDAVGLCFSDLKVIRAGQSHPRIYDDMRAKPVILGHELAVTVVAVGENRRARFRVGERYVVQADVYYQGRNLAVGYALPGGLEQYSVMGREVLDGDEGCYLLPVDPSQGYAEAALAEPWACVEAAYSMEYRTSLKPGGVAWFVGAPGAGDWLLTRGLDEHAHPRAIVLTDVPPCLAAGLRAEAGSLGVPVFEADGLAPERYAEAAALAGASAFDDILLLGPHRAESIASAMALVATGGAVVLASAEPYPEPVPVDIGRLHYDRILLGGTQGPDLAKGYRSFDRDLPAGGTVWLLGASGPMGHMHLQRALQRAERPARIIASGRRAARLGLVERRYAALARRLGVEFVCLSEQALGAGGVAARVGALTAGRGVDYCVVLAPDPRVVAEAWGSLAPGGVLNLFAGLNRGTQVALDLNPLRDRRQLRIIGSSGSRIEDLKGVLEKARLRALAPEQATVAVTGLEGARQALQGVAEGLYPGKVVVYPQAHALPLTTLDEMPRRMPAVAAHLGEGGVWTNEAEEELLREYLGTRDA